MMVCLLRKPVVGTVVDNALHWGSGTLGIDAGRVETNWAVESSVRLGHTGKQTGSAGVTAWNSIRMHAEPHMGGRFPANLILVEGSWDGPLVKGATSRTDTVSQGMFAGGLAGTVYGDSGSASRFFKQVRV